MNAIESTKHYKDRIKAELENTLTTTSLTKGTKRTGKVRDQYDRRVRKYESQRAKYQESKGVRE